MLKNRIQGLDARKELAEQLIAMASERADRGTMATSARLCLDEANTAYGHGAIDVAQRWALRSLAFSVGTTSPVYKVARQLV